MGEPTDGVLAKAIAEYLETADLLKVTPRTIRKVLEEKFGCKLKHRKEVIKNKSIDAIKRIENRREQERKKQKQEERKREDNSDDSDDEDDQPVAPRNTSIKNRIGGSSSKRSNIEKPANRREQVTTFQVDGVFYSRTGRAQRSTAAKRQIASQMRKGRKRPATDEKRNGEKKKKKSVFSKRLTVTSPLLAEFLGQAEMPRQEAHGKIWEYLKENCEYCEKDKRFRILSSNLQKIFKVRRVSYFSLNKYLSKYMKDPELCKPLHLMDQQ
mmetsp:Transcript_33956/g.82342  ORF Transcript_33956/g.82342 Transcript_33956/m.82342 type:complete len:269 (-) Transcript_33956:243-1049(-)|eukprot:CAMPEP_0114515918 /NCGR_PEP_ID=MMETSP0109-20121206/17033_1 /TAXON_ID=29199 /ORGANISM="Chlorarachnion reptans, Strain CCCM449" /LENGTH=268 /DNA_ID=CAMNT_0001696237 /DNA_START=155 /DNA_END=961 /DNA_ORIENTATION=+